MLCKGCPYLHAKTSKFKESGCEFNITGAEYMLSLKGEKVRDIYSCIHKESKDSKKSVDLIIFATNNKTEKRVLLVEISNHMHSLSDLRNKFENSLKNFQAIWLCDKENLRDLSIKLVIIYKKIKTSSEFEVIKSEEIKFRGENYRFYLNKCNKVFDLK